MAHEAEIIVPGSFVVLQGVSGDGMSNTIDSVPVILAGDNENIVDDDENNSTKKAGATNPDDHHDDHHDDFLHVRGDNDNDDAAVFYDTISYEGRPSPTLPLYSNPSLLPSRGMSALSVQPLATTAAAGAKIPVGRPNNAQEEPFVVVDDGADDARERRKTPSTEGIATRASTETQTTMASGEQAAVRRWTAECRAKEQRERNEWLTLHETKSELAAQNTWWMQEGKIAILAGLPSRIGDVVISSTIGTLPPGATVVGTDLVCLDTETMTPLKLPESVDKKVQPRGRQGWIQLLAVESPVKGYVTLSIDGYSFLGPGLPAFYADPQVWVWRVTCAVGAFVREGLELTTKHVETLPHGTLLRVTRKTVNALGLSRLRVHALVDQDGMTRYIEGWISEFLNPLSGQRGSIAEPLPFPVPAQYRVTLPEGAVIRNDVELSSPQIGHAAEGTILSVVGRSFSEHPMDQCIERLRLAGNGGWISVRLNRPKPLDEVVVEMVGLEGTFDPGCPGKFHLEALDRVREEQEGSRHAASNDAIGVEEMRQGEISSIDEDGRGVSELSSSDSSSSKPAPAAVSRSCKPVKRSHDEKCLICLTEERNATIVHGETGHIACCLVCARILYARGDRCPVCRLAIDSVIQHFWA